MSNKKTLILIESPNKKHCIESALGTDEYVVMASVGGVYDLPVNKFAIDIENDFNAEYVVMDSKVDIVENIKKEYKKCKDVILATDLDVEGEGIAWGLAQILNVKNPMRMVYNDTNKKTIQKARNNLVPLNMNKVDVQHCRRYLDRIIGYKLSPLLWKIMNSGGSLSAGRVQSVACRLIMEKHFDVRKFFESDVQSYFKVTCEFNKKYKADLYTNKKNNFKSDSDNDDVDSDKQNNEKQNAKKGKLQIAKIIKEKETRSVLESISCSVFTVSDITEKESTRSPCEPFHTTTVCQEASRKLHMSTERTMNAAQNLFAHGYCTYHRTDSVILSDDAIKSIGKYVVDKYGKNYYREKQYTNKKSGTQGAHECLRVTDPTLTELKQNGKINQDEIRLYKLIWRRTIASQMAPAKFKTHTAEIDISKLSDYKFITDYEECIFDGFLKVYNQNETASDSSNSDSDNDTDKKNTLPKKGSILDISNVIAIQDYKKPPSHFDEPAFLGKLKALKIGRPATIKSIISKIQTANYVKVEDLDGVEKKSVILKLNSEGKIKEECKSIWLGKEKRKFVPTDLGISITKFLIQNFPDIMDYQFTSNMEEKLDDIEEGKVKILDVLNEFYSTFSPLLEKLEDSINVDKLSLKQMNEIGIHPDLKFKIYTTLGKYGPVVQMLNDNNKIVNTAPIKKPLTMETIKVSDAVELFRFPIDLGRYGKKSVNLCRGKFGYYLEYGSENKTRISLNIDDDDVKDYKLENAIEKINEKKEGMYWEGKNETYQFKVLDGQYGKYINATPIKKNARVKAINCKLPDNIDPHKLTLDKVLEIIKNKYNKTKKTDKESKSNKKNDNSDDSDSDHDDKETQKKEKPKPKAKNNKKNDNSVKDETETKKEEKPKGKKTPKPKITKEKKMEIKNMFNIGGVTSNTKKVKKE